MDSPYRSVAEDLAHIRAEWEPEPKLDAVRRGSAILRRLLLEGVLQRAWKHHGFAKEPLIKAPDLILLANRRPQDVKIGIAGGANYGGQIAHSIMLTPGAGPRALPDGVDTEWLVARPWKLSEFVTSPCLIVGGELVSRGELIKYFAHVEGGVHFDRSSRVRREMAALVHRVDRLKELVQVHHAYGLYFALLSIGQAVAKAPDLVRLGEAILA